MAIFDKVEKSLKQKALQNAGWVVFVIVKGMTDNEDKMAAIMKGTMLFKSLRCNKKLAEFLCRA